VTRAVPIRIVGVAVWFLLWAGATFWAGAIGERIHPGQFTADTVGAALVLLIAFVVRWETGSWLGFVLTLLPLVGLVYSLRSFWRLPARLHPARAASS
jgi:hypothetical protein